MLIDTLLEHPLFEERPIREVLEPMGFVVEIQAVEYGELGGDHLEFDEIDKRLTAYAYRPPEGYLEVARWQGEDDCVIVSVRPTDAFSTLLLMGQGVRVAVEPEPLAVVTGTPYEAWRVSFQSSEQAARAAFAGWSHERAKVDEMQARCLALEALAKGD